MNIIISSNKQYWPTNFIFTLNNPTLTGKQLLEKAKSLPNLRYIIFQEEKGKSKNIPHFQGYIEFNTRQSKNKLNSQLFDDLAHLEARRGTQKEAIEYVTKEYSRVGEIYQWGKPKKFYNLTNPSNPDIPKKREEQWIHIEQSIIKGKYLLIEDIHKDYPYLVIHNEKKLQDLINKYNSSSILPTACKTIWLYGESGSGKSTWTFQYLTQKGYKDKEVSKKKSPHGTAPRLWFHYEDKNKKVLWIEEVRENFPNKNDLLNLIDKDALIEIKHGHIRNNFKLIIINSLLPPWEVYPINEKINASEQAEVLRRLFDGQIIEITANLEQLKILRQEKVTPLQFVLQYRPIARWITHGDDRKMYKNYLSKINYKSY